MALDPPDIFAFTNLPDYLAAWFRRLPARSANASADWLGSQIGCTRQHIWNFVAGERKVQPEHVSAFCRALDLDGERREYFRRLVALQNATVADLKEANLSVWELHAAHTGIPAAEIAAMLARDPPPGAAAGTLLPLLDLLRHLEVEPRPRELEALLLAPPDPLTTAEALTRSERGERAGQPLTPRLSALVAPEFPDSPVATLWHGLLDQGREHLLRVPASERDYHGIVWSADAEAAAGAALALERLEQALTALTRQTAGHPVRRLYLLTTQQVQLTDVLRSEKNRPAPETDPGVLPAPGDTSRVQEGSVNPPRSDGRPCLILYLTFSRYARAWVAWRKRRGEEASLSFLAMRMRASRSVVHRLISGQAPLRPEHVAGVSRALDLSPDEAIYLEGLARYEQAVDIEERARERTALITFAAQRGVRTLEGDSFRVAGHWGAQAVYALSFLPTFRNNPAWISIALRGRIPWQEAEKLVDALLAIGWLVPRPGGKVAPAVVEMQGDAEWTGLASFAWHDSALRLLQGELLFLTPGQRFRGWMVALPDEAIPHLRTCFDAYKAEIERCLQDSDARAATTSRGPDRVMLCCGQLFPLTHPLRAAFAPDLRHR